MCKTFWVKFGFAVKLCAMRMFPQQADFFLWFPGILTNCTKGEDRYSQSVGRVK